MRRLDLRKRATPRVQGSNKELTAGQVKPSRFLSELMRSISVQSWKALALADYGPAPQTVRPQPFGWAVLSMKDFEIMLSKRTGSPAAATAEGAHNLRSLDKIAFSTAPRLPQARSGRGT